ncbi:MAG: endo alpha-1,4 polygalactosaminidase [Candidatus Aegiribacteria sp.]|nr:endo alpha-1,4 polygalactosaminidase [Candidatus Aegiribacteria sp.]
MKIQDLIYGFLSIVLLHTSCVTGSNNGPSSSMNYRDEMREFIQDISSWAKYSSPGFFIIPQNGQELFTTTGTPDGSPASSYLNTIDGSGREDLFYGYTGDDISTPASDTEWMLSFLDLGEAYGIEALVTDYCSTHWKMDSSYVWCEEACCISFAADHRDLDNIPAYPSEPWNMNQENVSDLADADNFLYLINPGEYSSRQEFIEAVAATEYDLLIIDLFWNGEQLTAQDISQLRDKPGGGSRLIIAYMSIGEAEDYRYYWQQSWSSTPPSWLHGENPDWPGNYLVEYWNSDWQEIIFGSNDSYLGQIIDSGFDGAYLDKVDSFETWEN